jgi:hypothetical protein
MRKILPKNPNPDKPVGAKRKSRFIGEPKKINHENTKKRRPKFRAFQLSCFRDEKKFYHKMQKNNY